MFSSQITKNYIKYMNLVGISKLSFKSCQVFPSLIDKETKTHTRNNVMSNSLFHLLYHPSYTEEQNKKYTENFIKQLNYVKSTDSALFHVTNQLKHMADSNIAQNVYTPKLKCLVIDLDNLNRKEIKRLISTLGKINMLPDLYFKTAHGIHLYYTSEKVIHPSKYKALHSKLSYILAKHGFTADAAVSCPTGLLRAWGSMHIKYNSNNERIYTQMGMPIFLKNKIRSLDSGIVTKLLKQYGYFENVDAASNIAKKDKPVGCSSFTPIELKAKNSFEVISQLQGKPVSMRFISAILHQNGVELERTAIQRQISRMIKDGYISVVKKGKWIPNGKGISSEYAVIKQIPENYFRAYKKSVVATVVEKAVEVVKTAAEKVRSMTSDTLDLFEETVQTAANVVKSVVEKVVPAIKLVARTAPIPAYAAKAPAQMYAYKFIPEARGVPDEEDDSNFMPMYDDKPPAPQQHYYVNYTPPPISSAMSSSEDGVNVEDIFRSMPDFVPII